MRLHEKEGRREVVKKRMREEVSYRDATHLKIMNFVFVFCFFAAEK